MQIILTEEEYHKLKGSGEAAMEQFRKEHKEMVGKFIQDFLIRYKPMEASMYPHGFMAEIQRMLKENGLE